MKTTIKKWFRDGKWVSLISFCIFIGIAAGVFLKVTYLFRHNDSSRSHIVGLKEERELDVVYVGGSAAFVYWEPPRAWKEYGIASYNYAMRAVPAEMLLGSIREVRKTHNPELFIVGVRAFQYWDEEGVEIGIRYTADSMDYSWNRWLTVHDYLKRRNVESKDRLSYYLEIVKYHTNTEVMGDPVSWEFSDNKGTVKYNGFDFAPEHERLSTPEGFQTKERKKLAAGSEDTLIELLEYCKREDLNVLFVVCPYWITKEHKMLYNSMQDMVESYGYTFLDANEYYEEIKIDFSRDFYERSHVNEYGAEKYTRFLAEYIKQHYQIADRRGEPGMEDWDAMYDAFEEDDKFMKNAIDQRIARKETAYLQGSHLPETDNIYEWCIKAKNDNYTILMGFQGKPWQLCADAEWMLKQWEISENAMAEAIRVYIGGTKQYAADAALEAAYQANFTGRTDETFVYKINSGKEGGIWIDGERCDIEGEGLHVVVYDNNYREVLDSVLIVQTKEGLLQILRQEEAIKK